MLKSIESSNDKLNHTAVGRTELRHAFARSREVSKELHYVLDHPSDYGIIEASGLQLFGGSLRTKFLPYKAEYRLKS